MTRAREAALALALIGALVVVEWRLIARQKGAPPVQGNANIEFAAADSLGQALSDYPTKWPPLFPVLLWGGQQAGMKKWQTQLALHAATLLLLWPLSRRLVGVGESALLVILYGLLQTTVVTLRQMTSESLVVPLSLAMVLLLLRYQRQPGWGRLLAIAPVCAALGVTRYFAGLVFGAVAAGVILWPRGQTWRRRAAHLAALGVLSALPLAAWLGVGIRRTGEATGMDRFGERALPASVQRWKETVSLPWNLRFAGKTLVIDFFSPSLYASHAIVDYDHDYSAVEVGLTAVALLAMGLAVAAARRGPASGEDDGGAGRLVAAVTCAYLVLLIAVWSVSNNDPLYTRFLYPCYVFLVLTGFHAHARVRARAPRWQRVPFWLLYAGTLAVQVVRDVRGVTLPLR